MILNFKFENINKEKILYVLKSADNGMNFHIGIDTLANIFLFKDMLKSTREYLEREKQINLTIEILKVSCNFEELIVFAYSYINNTNNTHLSKVLDFKRTRGEHGKTLLIRCIETGEVFPSVTECCRAHTLTRSALHNHLNGLQGHKTVKGRTYERITTI